MIDSKTKTIKALGINNVDIPINATYWDNHSINDIKTINGESIFSDGGGNIDLQMGIEITYSNLKTLRDNNRLSIGQQYRITDYVTTTTQINTQSAGHQFDIIVTADGKNSLNEIARVCLHDGDTYFSNVNLESWRIWYCLDNDTERFIWADSEGTGVIYRMIDDNNNDCPYDFKNIQFTRDSSWLNLHKSKFDNLKKSKNQTKLDFYTFSKTSGTTTVSVSDGSLNNHCRNNIICEYFDSENKRMLNDTIFIGDICESNSFGKGNNNNTFGSCKFNIVGDTCRDNIVYSLFNNNIGYGFNNNQIGFFSNCNVGCDFSSNTSSGEISLCNFGNFISCGSLPSMKNVIFDNEIIKGNLNDIALYTGQNAYVALEELSENDSEILFTKRNDVYYLVSVAEHERKFEIIYDLGIFVSDEDAYNAAKDFNVIRNPKVLFIKYITGDKTVYIIQMVNLNGDGSGFANQYLLTNGEIKSRKCNFSNISIGDVSEWVKIQDRDNILYSNGYKVLTTSDESRYLTSDSDITIDKSVTFKGDVDFSNANIIGDNLVNKSHIDEINEHIKENERVTAFAFDELVTRYETLEKAISNLQIQMNNILEI
jgi:hypothetical protein